MKWLVIVPKKAQRDIAKIDKRYEARVMAVLGELEIDPFLGKKLEGEHKDKRSYEVWPYRIVYRLINNERAVLIIRVGHR